jgi:hypothetical protein
LRRKLGYVNAVYIILLVVIFISPFLIPTSAYAWGAVKSDSWVIPNVDTHHPILEQAWARLTNDPAYKDQPDIFPAKADIMSWEGVYVESVLKAAQWGAESKGGPDASDKSKESEHMYNPDTRGGNAPESVREQFQNLIYIMYPSIKEGDVIIQKGAKGAAWSAHYLADMLVPYHTFGVPSENVTTSGKTTLTSQEFGSYLLWQPGKFKLDEKGNVDTGSVVTPSSGWGKNGDFSSAIEVFKGYRLKD